MAVADYGALESEDGTRSFTIETLRPAKDFLVARFAGVTDRTAAEQLRNTDLYVARDRLPAPGKRMNSYHADLVGLAVVDKDGNALGLLKAIHNFGAGDLLEIEPAGGSDTLMVPFTDATVPDIDMKARRMVVVLPAEVGTKGED